MGNDGGVVAAKRRFMVKQKAKAAKERPDCAKWTTCALSGRRIGPTAMCDELGHLMDAEAALEYLRAGARVSGFEHIRKLKHLVRLSLTPAKPGGSKPTEGGLEVPAFQCPVTGLEADGRHAFIALKPCGHVVAAQLLQSAPQSTCWTCGVAFVLPGRQVAAAGEVLERAEALASAAGRASSAVAGDAPAATEWVGSDVIVLNPRRSEAAAAGVLLAASRRAKRRPREATVDSPAKRSRPAAPGLADGSGSAGKFE